MRLDIGISARSRDESFASTSRTRLPVMRMNARACGAGEGLPQRFEGAGLSGL
jgi:hypothetical protein